MYINVSRSEVWAASLNDKPGELADKLLCLAMARANLELVIARRTAESPGKGVVFVAPIEGERPIAAAQKCGFTIAQGLHGVRLTGPDAPGAAQFVACAIAEEGLNLRGFTAASVDREFVIYLAFDSEQEADDAVARLRKAV